MRVLRECPRGGILNLEAHLPHSALRANRRAFYRLERTFVKCWIFDGHCHPPSYSGLRKGWATVKKVSGYRLQASGKGPVACNLMPLLTLGSVFLQTAVRRAVPPPRRQPRSANTATASLGI